MKLPPYLSLSCAALFACTQAVNAQVVLTAEITGVFDPLDSGGAAGTNNVDAIVQGASSNLTIDDWRSMIATAHSNGFGAVWNAGGTAVTSGTAYLDSEPNEGTNFNSAILNYASGKALEFALTTSSPERTLVSNQFGSATQVSGRRNLSLTGAVDSYSIAFTLSGDALLIGERVTDFGLVLLGRAPGGTATGEVTLTATLDDNSTISLSKALLSNNTDDTLFAFQAPEGRFFTGYSYSSTTNRENPFDDFAFRTAAIPEPSSVALIAASCGLLGLRRRRNS